MGKSRVFSSYPRKKLPEKSELKKNTRNRFMVQVPPHLYTIHYICSCILDEWLSFKDEFPSASSLPARYLSISLTCCLSGILALAVFVSSGFSSFLPLSPLYLLPLSCFHGLRKRNRYILPA